MEPAHVFHLNVSSLTFLRHMVSEPHFGDNVGTIHISTLNFRDDALSALDDFVQPCGVPWLSNEDEAFCAALRAKMALKSSISATRDMDLSGLMGRILTETLAMVPNLTKIVVVGGSDLWEPPLSCDMNTPQREGEIVSRMLTPQYILDRVYDLDAYSRTHIYVKNALWCLGAQGRVRVVDGLP